MMKLYFDSSKGVLSKKMFERMSPPPNSNKVLALKETNK